jgi:alkanesulfonate monooxygenase SsuD/methylene tetrahydromethanopterin reductase-like flavin-dependent oxidoreductase (luciferase family)
MQAYHEHFRPSGQLAEPYGMVTMQVVVADTEAEARAIADAFALVFLRMRQGGPPRVLPTAAEVAAYAWSPEERRMADAMIDAQAVGTADQVLDKLRAMIETTGAAEIMATTLAADPATRMRSYELLAEAAELG